MTRFEQVPLRRVPVLAGERRYQVLNVSTNRGLLQTRTAILEAAGFRTVPAASLAAAVRAIATKSFEVIILCHAMPPKHKAELMRLARQHLPHVHVLGLYVVSPAQASGADVALDSSSGPAALIDAVRRAV